MMVGSWELKSHESEICLLFRVKCDMGMFVWGKKMSYNKLEPHPTKPKEKTIWFWVTYLWQWIRVCVRSFRAQTQRVRCCIGDGVLLLSAALVPAHSGSPPESPCNHPRLLLPSGIISVSCPWSAAAARVRGTRTSGNNSHGSIGEERWWRRPSFPQGCCI